MKKVETLVTVTFYYPKLSSSPQPETKPTLSTPPKFSPRQRSFFILR